ncbi:YdeI/OmpD-associated family protein [Elizabethkingia anophelis]|uniref:YdeI/OmpD-associated family protein n=1 Tax=Elizabethkingia anophelis TaxID=1117645 RepID=UPI0016246811|nr:YdeI/OmpD-associated family protein [Elizabethkingia anophelis]MCT3648008.1 YdeI/OmpD-associated family protein [Elizabethkingia anophelis]MCT3693673.1 YdeI/OmpD-associated family protein [Elizabethkingia anophelis]MCT3858991.1 YdeI/OmpD-associated family protein [Elizabethkingia anophelis]MCT3912417.1 YdeI/OmpD-associated family protein [Elizabethkingia anophelis]MCT4309942.1 YdeI/OmpD-associated family protein [Elizabethkingia anophelis]
MTPKEQHNFTAKLEIIGINPFVFLPPSVLEDMLKHYENYKGKIPIKGKVNGVDYIQTLVKYSGEWRLYINTTMLKNSPKRIGEILNISIEVDHGERKIEAHPKLLAALEENPEALNVFNQLRPSSRNEIIKYISYLKTEQSIDKNVAKAINFLLGKERFVGRDKPELKLTKNP